MAVHSRVKVRVRGLSLWPIGCIDALSVTQKAPLQLWLVALYKCYMSLPSLLPPSHQPMRQLSINQSFSNYFSVHLKVLL